MSRPRLTPHQREVYERLSRISNRLGGGFVPGTYIGSAGALERLVRKGYAERVVTVGPRGGEHPHYRPRP